MPTRPEDLPNGVKKRIFHAILLRFFIPNFVFIPFFIYGFYVGPFILALLLRGWLQRSVEHMFADEFCFIYLSYAISKKEREQKND